MWSKGLSTLFSRDIGQLAETRAAHFLEQQGLTLLERNYSCRRGEIDLIMAQEHSLIFVEVKYRTNHAYGYGAEYFTPSKRKKLEAAISHYLRHKKLNPNLIAHRIDVISMDNDEIHWFKAV